ncbi:tail fiber domain-containing protein [Gemella massiliensis]|uniref:tail fiber domain-containing protein n=1 Tax=Gemella massiliensis TaxID=1909670 RepID=UPI000930399F|nr:tail fiber domain-containing protein [Gemella massiliensis]
MIIRAKTEKNLASATDVKLTKTQDYQDTLGFKLPIDEDINVDEIIHVGTSVFNQDYRVKEIITKEQYKDVFCEHVFFDCKNIIIPFVDEGHEGSYNDFSRYGNIELICGHLNRIVRAKGMKDFTFDSNFKRDGVIECNDTPLYDLIFGEKGILKTFDCHLEYDNYKVTFVHTASSKNTEILFHESKNISQLQETVDFKNIVTKYHVTCKYQPDNSEEGKAERERKKAQARRERFEKSQQKIKEREKKEAEERLIRQQKAEQEYQANKNRPKRTQDEIHQEHLRKQQENNARILENNAAREEERRKKFEEQEKNRKTEKEEKEKIFRTIYKSPLIDKYARVYEASLSIGSSDIDSVDDLKRWCEIHLFNEEDTRDVPIKNYSFNVADNEYRNININDKAMVVFDKLNVRKVINCCKIVYDALNDKYLEVEFGEINKSSTKQLIGSINAKIEQANNQMATNYRILDENFQTYVQKEIVAHEELYNIRSNDFEKNLEKRIEEAHIKAEELTGEINTAFEKDMSKVREDVNKARDDFDKNLNETKKEIEKIKSGNIGKIADLEKEIASAKEKGETAFNKVTELNGEVTREFEKIKKDTNDSINAVKSEFKVTADGLSNKIVKLEDYVNKDGERTQTMKSWVETNTVEALKRERTEVLKVIDGKGYVTAQNLTNKLEETSKGVTREISSAIDNISYSNRNLLLNTHFPDSNSIENTSATLKINQNDYNGHNSIEWQVTGATSNGWKGLNVKSSISSVKKGDKLVIRLPIYIFSDVNDDAGVKLRLKNHKNNSTLKSFNLSDNMPKNQWVIKEIKFIAESDFDFTKNNFFFVAIDKNGHCKIAEPYLGYGTVIPSSWSPAPEDSTNQINALNTWKQTATETLNKVGSINPNDLVKYSQMRITDDGIDFGSGRQFNGKSLASMLRISPDSIQAITDKFIITPSNENLVEVDKRNEIGLEQRSLWLTSKIKEDNLLNKNEFRIIGEFIWQGNLTYDLNFIIEIKRNGQNAEYFFKKIASKNSTYISSKRGVDLRVNPDISDIEYYRLGIYQEGNNNFHKIACKNLEIRQKRSAELIVDGTINSKHISTGSIETGHISAGSIQAIHMTAESITADALKVDEAMINKLLVNNLLVKELFANSAFINKLQAVDISATQITTGYLSGDRIYGGTIEGVTITGSTLTGTTKIKIGEYGYMQPVDRGLQINTPASYTANYGTGVQILGDTWDNYPKGIFIYHDPDFSVAGQTVYPNVDNTLLTVHGYAAICNKFNGNPVQGHAIISNRYKDTPVNGIYKIAFIGWDGRSGQLYVDDGTGSSGTWWFTPDSSSSDRRLKLGIEDSNYNAIEFIEKLNFKQFDWKRDKFGHKKDYTKCGLIAQDIQALDSSLVFSQGDKLALDDFRLGNIGLKAIQELNIRLKRLEEKIGA